jgi:hypothetical protein
MADVALISRERNRGPGTFRPTGVMGIRLMAAGIVACVLAGCSVARESGGDEVGATVLAMDAGGWAPGTFAALSDSPIHLGAFASWYGWGAQDFKETTDEAPAGSAYLAVTASTGCRAPEGVEVSRVRDDLVVVFTGGVDHEECVRAVGPGAYLAVPADAVAGVRTVNGEPLLDPAGPGELVDLLPLGTGRFDPVAAAEFGTDALATFRAGVIAARPGHADEVTAALDMPVPDGRRGFAFVVPGCDVEDVVLVVGPDHVKADAAEPGTPVACEVFEYFLATFAIDTDQVPEGATPSN